MRVAQPAGTAGSLKWIQIAVERYPELIQPPDISTIQWVSPLAEDDFAEYRDQSFLERLQLDIPAEEMKAFWPQRGPQWDALGISKSGPVLVEAKAHVHEFFTSPSQAKGDSRQQILDAFSRVKADLNIRSNSDWSQIYFQYANRISFLWWLHSMGIPAKLLFVSFLNAEEMNGPTERETWKAVFAGADYALSLPKRHKLTKHIHHVYTDVRLLKA